jgi:hypothetical protein
VVVYCSGAWCFIELKFALFVPIFAKLLQLNSFVFFRGGAATDPDGKPGLNPCLGDVYVNGSVVNYQTYLVRYSLIQPFSTCRH